MNEGNCRSCGEPIWWLRKTDDPNGKPNPIDRQEHEGGNLSVVRVGGQVVSYDFVGKGKGTHISHFSTCAQADRWKKKDRSDDR